MWVVLEPLTHLSSPVEAHVTDQLWVIYLARCTQCDVPTTLAGGLNNGPLANDVSAPSPPLHQVESHLINKDVLVQHISCRQHKNASYSMDTERSTQWATVRHCRKGTILDYRAVL
ncbi:unnamed protein product [Pleuronectes platessa]|uniref:Uncharacterized protein n=1 Tax=Pleuronectes platessa TaxID=8262 RepID=A0A9N7UFD4_PLEPL|nr:unnamed protein product [Pleuronectes platessa]